MSRRNPKPDPSAVAAPISRLARWMRARRLAANLAAVVVTIAIAVHGAASRKQAGEPAMADIDVAGAWRLLRRPLLWARALRARFDAEVEAARADSDLDPPERLLDRRERLLEHGNPLRRSGGLPRRKSTDGCIAGIPTPEVIARIRADLVTAATLIGDAALGRKVAAISEMLRALTDEAETAPPAPAAAAAPATRAGPVPFDFRTSGVPDTVPANAAIRWPGPGSG